MNSLLKKGKNRTTYAVVFTLAIVLATALRTSSGAARSALNVRADCLRITRLEEFRMFGALLILDSYGREARYAVAQHIVLNRR